MNTGKYGAKSIVEAGLMSALIVIIFMLNTYMPFFSYIGLFILPIPITVLYLRHNFRTAISAVAVSAAIICMVSSPISAIGSVFLYGSSGLVMGHCIKEHRGSTITIIYLSIAMLIGTIIDGALTIYLLYDNSLTSMLQEVIDMMNESMDMALSMYNTVGVDTSSMSTIMDQFKSITPETIMFMIPAILILASFLQAFINYAITRKIVSRFKYEVPKFRPFNEWYIDNRIGAGLIGVTLISTILIGKGISIGQYLYMTSAYVLKTACSVIGVAIIYNWFVKRGTSNKFILVMLLIFAVINPLISQLTYIIGLADLIFDFRKLDPNSLMAAIRERKNKSSK